MAFSDYTKMEFFFNLSAVEFMNAFLLWKSRDADLPNPNKFDT